MRYVDMTFAELVAAIHGAEKAYERANEDQDFDVADKHHDAMYIAFKHLVSIVQKDDPYTTEADIRCFEGFKYV